MDNKLAKTVKTGLAATAVAGAAMAVYETKVKHFSYSKIDTIPSGSAPEQLVDGCIALEGGSLRGLYTAGVLDALMAEGVNLQTTVGVSAGAMCGFNYVSGQIGRTARFNLSNRFNQRYVGVGAYVENQSPFGFKYVFEDETNVEKLDRERFMDPARRFVAVATNIETVEPAYLDRDEVSDVFGAIRASATLPVVSEPVELDGVRYLDGGVTVSIPYQWPVDQGYEKIVIVRTLSRDAKKQPESSATIKLAEQRYKDNPQLITALKNKVDRYDAEVWACEKLEEEGRAFIIAPSEPVTISRMEADLEKLGDLYWLGHNDAMAQMADLKTYLNMA